MKKHLLIYLLLILSLRAYCQCTLNVTISQSSPTICSGYSVTLTAVTSGGTAPFSYAWSTGETTKSIVVNNPGTYTVTVTDKTPGCKPVQQSATVNSTTTPNAPSAAGVVVCQNSSAMLTATAPGGVYQWYDAPTGGNFLASGATYNTPPIATATTFFVQTTVGGCTSPRAPVFVSLTSKPTAAGVSICAGNVATLIASGGVSYEWFNVPAGGAVLSTSDTYTTPVLAKTTTYYVSSVSNSGCVSPRTAVTVFVTATPTPPTASNVSVCSGSSANLHANGPSTIFNWYSVPAGGAALISSPDYTTPSLTVTTTYYVSSVMNQCESSRTAVTVTVNAIPTAPTAQNFTICYQSNITLNASGSNAGVYQWYDAAVSGNLLTTGSSYPTPVLTNSTTYYVQATNGTCTSPRTPINVTVSPQLPAPSAAGAVICYGTTAFLTASAPGGGTFQWYDAATGGNLLANGANFTTPALTATTTYYVQNTQAGCISPRASVTVTVLTAVSPPTAANATICSGNTASISATGSTGSYAWYDSAAGGNLLATTQAFVTPVLNASATYYVEADVNGCASTRTPVTITVNPTPSAPTVSGITICPGMSGTLMANVAVNWYNAASGGNLLATGMTFTTPVLTNTTTYYAGIISGQCAGPLTPVTVTINNPEFQYPQGTYCQTGANAVPVINNPSGGTFSAAPGLVFVSTTTGVINVGASTPGGYVVSFTGNGGCTGVTSANISIVTSVTTNFSYSGPFCQGGANPLPIFSGGGSAGTFTAAPAGLVFLNASTGEIDLATSKAGTYTITNTFTASGSCLASKSTAMVTISPQVIISAGPNQTVPTGSAVQLAGSISGGATTGKWSGGAGTFSNPALTNAVYTPAAGETMVTLTLTSTPPTAPCGPKSATVTITFSALPAAPTAQNASDCSGSSVTLSATAPGGVYKWYNAANGGILLSTGPNFTTNPLNTNITYYVQTTLNGLTSTRTAVTVTINSIPAAPASSNTMACAGSPTTLTATGSAGTYQWYDAPAGGNLLSNGNTYTTPSLTANASYYVESVVSGCISARTKVDVTVTTAPNVTSAAAGSTCSGQPLNYTITADQATATFNWGRAQVAGISNPALTNQTSSPITETLINTGTAAVKVTYVITPIVSNCSGPAFNYVVTVNPTPVVTSAASASICNMTPINYAVTFNAPVAGFTWDRAAVPGVSNATVTGQSAAVIQEVLFNTTNSPVNVTYVFNYKTATCDGVPFNFVVTVFPKTSITSRSVLFACTGEPQNYVITSNIPSATFTWSRAAVANISNPAVTNQTSGTISETLINTSAGRVNVVYNITPMANGCPGAPFRYVAVVNPKSPATVANGNSPVCIGTTLHLSTPPVLNATYLWTGPNGFTSTLRNPDVNNVTLADAGVYTMVFTVNGCTGQPVNVTVVVDQLPVVNAGPDQAVCINANSVQLAGTSSTTTGIWSGGSGTFLPSSNTLNARYIPSAADKATGAVVLKLTSSSKDNCAISTSNMTMTFSNEVITSAAKGAACSGVPQNYVITSNIPTATFVWLRPVVPNISNPAVNNQTSSSITETLINTSANPVNVFYTITPLVNGCPGTPFNYTVRVNNKLLAPVPTSNSPVCVATSINLSAATIANGTYSWTGPNGFTSTQQNPVINNVNAGNAGDYVLVYTVNGCNSPPGTVTVIVDQLPVATAGPNQNVCVSDPAIQLAGTVNGGTNTGMWMTSGSGNFLPSSTDLTAQYVPSAADKTAGPITLTLTSTSADNCKPSISTMTINFTTKPAVTAGGNQVVCNETTGVQLQGSISIDGGATWSTSGTGNFIPSKTQVITTYVPGAADIKSGSVTLTLTANNPGVCFSATDNAKITFIPPPTVSAGGIDYVLKGKTITLYPTVSDPNVQYLWTPNINMDNNTLKNPTVTGEVTTTYTLTVTDVRGCVSSDTALVKVSPLIKIINTFTPNGDGVNDHWDIKGLIAYQEASVDIFDRWGQKVFHSIGYPKPWDGTYNGKAVPVGVYYYVINAHFQGQVFSGWVTVIR